MSRDRDPAGRPRQARPRDALGRPLPYGAVGVEPVPEEPLPPLKSLQVARQLVVDGRPFAAHEVLEARWKAGPAGERDLWQGLAQLCVGLTHAARGNRVGAFRLVERAAGRLEAYGTGEGPTYGLDLTALVACARSQAARKCMIARQDRRAAMEAGRARVLQPEGYPAHRGRSDVVLPAGFGSAVPVDRCDRGIAKPGHAAAESLRNVGESKPVCG